MFTVEKRASAIDLVELGDTSHGSRVTVAPSRGAIATRFSVGERELLFLDEGTFLDPRANVRGGIPILFPSPGKLDGDRFERDGRRGAMRQHGFARTMPFRVEETATAEEARVVLGLASNEASLAAFPWPHHLRVTYALRGTTLRVTLSVTNDASSTMPFAAGFHPYFAVRDGDKAEARLATRATRAFDNVTKASGAFRGFDFTAPELDLHLLDHGEPEALLETPAGDVRVRASSEMALWVVWTLRGRDFVCVEPWTSPGNALNTGDRLVHVEPGETRSVWMEIVAE